MSALAEMQCEPCRADSPAATEDEKREWLAEIPDWTIRNVDGMDRLSRSYKFKNFVEALDFTNRVGALAEEHDHHPLLITEWGKTTVEWWTHSIGGLHRNDFILAAKTDKLRG